MNENICKLRLVYEKFFITGGEGFIGSHLIEQILKNGDYVNALVNYNSFGNIGWLENCINHKNINIFFGDLKDPDTYLKFLVKSEYVINLASLISVPYSYVASKSNLENNILGSHFLYNSCINLKIKKIIHVSSSEVYGTPKKFPLMKKQSLIHNLHTLQVKQEAIMWQSHTFILMVCP